MTEVLERTLRHGVDLGEAVYDERTAALTAAVHRRVELTHMRRAAALKVVAGVAGVWALLAALGSGGSADESGSRGANVPAAPTIRPLETDALAASMTQRSRGMPDGVAAQAALHCAPTGAAVGPLACDATWIPGGALLDGSATSVRLAADGSAIVDWEIRNVAPAEEWIDLATVAVALLTNPDEVAPVRRSRVADGHVGVSLWLGDETRLPVVADDWVGVMVAPGARVAGTTRLPAGAVPSGTAVDVALQAWLASPSQQGDTVALEVRGGAVPGAGAVDRVLAGATPRAFGDEPDGRDAALLCEPPDPTATDDVVPDGWGTGWSWAPTCEPVWLAPGRAPLAIESLRFDIDRSPDSRVARWRARVVGDEPVAIEAIVAGEAGEAIVVLELEPPVAPHAAREWESVTPTMARIDTLWRSDRSRTGLMRPESRAALVQPGQVIDGEQVFFFDIRGERAQARAVRWGPYLERSGVTVLVRLAGAAADGRVVLLELSAE